MNGGNKGEREERREKRGKEGKEGMSVSYVESSFSRGTNGGMERSLSPVILDVWIGSSRKQLLNVVPASTDSRDVEGSAAVVVGGINLHLCFQEVIDGAVVGSAGTGTASRDRRAACVRPGAALGRRGKESVVLAGLGRGFRAAAAARRDPDAIAVRVALGDDEHQRGVATWSHHVRVKRLPVHLLAAVDQDPHDLWVTHARCVEELPFPRVVTDLANSGHFWRVVGRRVLDGDLVGCPHYLPLLGPALHLGSLATLLNVVSRRARGAGKVSV